MVFSVNAATTGDKTMAAFKQLAINTNGTTLQPGALQSPDPNAQAAPTPITVIAGGGAGAVATPPAAAGAPGAVASVVPGQGQDAQGNACSCSCLCGVNDFPKVAALGAFGGFAGVMSS